MARPPHRIVHRPVDGWTFESDMLRYPIPCGCAKDAKRVAAAFRALFPHCEPADYTEVNAAIIAEAKEAFSISR